MLLLLSKADCLSESQRAHLELGLQQWCATSTLAERYSIHSAHLVSAVTGHGMAAMALGMQV